MPAEPATPRSVQTPASGSSGTAASAGEKQRVRFSQAEEDFLREGVVKHDESAKKWSDILHDPAYQFHESRSTVDLKDKWRNILKKDGAEEAD